MNLKGDQRGRAFDTGNGVCPRDSDEPDESYKGFVPTIRLRSQFFLWCLLSLNVKSYIEINGTHLLAMSQTHSLSGIEA